MLSITYELECTCGGEMVTATLDFGQDGSNDEVVINLNSISQRQLTCKDCGRTVYSSDIDEFFLEM